MTMRRFVGERRGGPFHDVVALYAQAHLLQIMQGTACNALHPVKQRCCRWLLQTQDRVGSSEFLLEAGFSRHHAGRAAPDRDARPGCTAGGRPDHEQVRAYSRPEEEARTDRMRVLRRHSQTVPAARVVIASGSGDRRRVPACAIVAADVTEAPIRRLAFRHGVCTSELSSHSDVFIM